MAPVKFKIVGNPGDLMVSQCTFCSHRSPDGTKCKAYPTGIGGIVGRPEIQKFAGALQGQRAKKGIFITTSDFTRDANDYAAVIDSRIVLINGNRLCNLMIDHGIGVTRTTSYEVKRLDSDYFEES